MGIKNKLAKLLPLALFFQLNCNNPNQDPDVSLSAGQNHSQLEESINEAQYYINEAIVGSRTPDFYIGQALTEAVGNDSIILNSEVFQLANRNGKLIFYNLEDVSLLVEDGGNLNDARMYAERGFYLNDMLIFLTLGINLEDTERPNAVITFPYTDTHSRPFGRHNLNHFLETLAEDYDIFPFLVRNVQEVKEAIYSNNDIELLILFGHGSRRSILLERNGDYRERIDIGDIQFCDYISHLNENAVIYLGSCLNGEGGRGAENLANMFMDCADGRTVISATDTFVPRRVRINSTYPFDISIPSNHNYFSIFSIPEDITYTGP